MTPMEDAKLD